jgi:hypothetical protein
MDTFLGIEVIYSEWPRKTYSFCITMFEDGVKGVDAEEKMQQLTGPR